MLENVTKRLEDVQQDLRKLLPPNAILVGHSLCSDFSALKVRHYLSMFSSYLVHIIMKKKSEYVIIVLYIVKNKF